MAARPQTTRYRDIPVVRGWRSVDRKQDAEAIIREHDYGMFLRSAPYVDELLTDDRIAGVLDTRIDALLAAPLDFEPAADRRIARRLVDSLNGETNGREPTGQWNEIVADAAARDLLKWGIMLGVGIAEIVWDRGPTAWIPRLVPWHPMFLRWDWSLRTFVLQTEREQVVLPRPDEQPRGDGKWFVYCPYGVQYGWKAALLRSLALKYVARQWNEQSWDRFCEKHGLAIVEGKVPANATLEEIEDFNNQLSRLGSEGTVITPQDEKGYGYGVSFKEAVARTWETFKDRKAELDADIAVRILGQNLTTQVSDGGSRAAAQIHNLVRLDKAMRDAAFGLSIRSQVLTWWSEFNFGDPEMAPWPLYRVEPEDDELAEATKLKMLGDALASLDLAESRVDRIAILEEMGVPLITEEELAAKQAIEEEQNPPPPAAPLGPDGKPMPPQPGQQPPPQPASTATRADVTTALMRLSARATGTVALKRSAAGARRAAKYQDDLLKRSQKIAAQSLSVDLATIKGHIDAATSWEDLRTRIARAFRNMDPTRLAKVLEKTAIMANLSGRLAAIKEI